MYQRLKAQRIEASNVLSNISISMQLEKRESNWTTNSTNMKEQAIHINKWHGCRSEKALKTSVQQKKILTYQTQHEKGHTDIPVERPPPPSQTREKKASRKPRWRKNYPQYLKKGNSRHIESPDRTKKLITRYTFNLQIEYQDHRSTTMAPLSTTAACSDWCEIFNGMGERLIVNLIVVYGALKAS